MTEGEARRRLAAARVAVLGTSNPDGSPHLVPVTFAFDAGAGGCAGLDTVVTALDAKPKRAATLRRHANLRRDPRASLLVQHWDEDWTALWWVRADGTATLHDTGPDVDRALGHLRAKYPQYADVALGPPVIRLAVTRWTCWEAQPW